MAQAIEVTLHLSIVNKPAKISRSSPLMEKPHVLTYRFKANSTITLRCEVQLGRLQRKKTLQTHDLFAIALHDGM